MIHFKVIVSLSLSLSRFAVLVVVVCVASIWFVIAQSRSYDTRILVFLAAVLVSLLRLLRAVLVADRPLRWIVVYRCCGIAHSTPLAPSSSTLDERQPVRQLCNSLPTQ